jgi:hypothetical protein
MMNGLTIPQQLEALQAVANNPDISRDDILLHDWTDDILTPGTPCRMTDKGQALWERFTKHLSQGYKRLTEGERLFWLTAYTGGPQPNDQTLINLIDATTSPDIRAAAITYYATHQGKNRVTDDVWGAIIANFLHYAFKYDNRPLYAKALSVVTPLVGEQTIQYATTRGVIAEWLVGHRQASDPLIHRWLYSGDGRIVAAVVEHIDPARLPLIDIHGIIGSTHTHTASMGSAFARVAQYFTVPQIETLLDNGVTTVSDMLAFGGPYADEQWELFDKYDHEAVETALGDYRRYALHHQWVRERLFANPNGRFATKVEESCLKPEQQEEQEAGGWAAM